MSYSLRCLEKGNEWSNGSGGGGQDSTKDKLILPYPMILEEMGVRVFGEGGVGLLACDIIYEIISN